MLIPRLILSIHNSSGEQVFQNQDSLAGHGLLLEISKMDRTEGLNKAHEKKKICLQVGIKLLLDNLEIAALVNADGVCCGIDDDMHGRAKDVLGEDKLVGGTAHTIQDVANLYEEGMVDFVVLESFMDEGGSENILGKQKAQVIIDDARIMGYDIPILLKGGIDGSNAVEALRTGAYGIVTRHLSHIESLKKELLNFPIR